MNITFLGYDYTIDIAQRLMADGHDIMQIFTFPCDNIFAFNTETHEFAAHFNIPISDHKIKSENITELIDKKCDIFICAGYPHKIPEINNNLCYGINLHPTLLPRARGIMPLPYVIMQEPKAAGFTIHKLSPHFDTGDILYQQPIPIDRNTDIEILSAQIALHSTKAIAYIVADIKKYWDNAKIQNHANSSSYLAPSADMRTINWSSTPEQLLLKGRAFGRFGVIAEIQNNMKQTQKLAVFNFNAWEEKHKHDIGYLLRSSTRDIIIAINSGYICLKEFQVIE